MLFWNLDKEIKDLETRLEIYGHFDISIHRVEMAHDRMSHFQLIPLAYQVPGARYYVWVVSLGTSLMPNPFYYGHTVREAWDKARRAALSLIKRSKFDKNLTGHDSGPTLLDVSRARVA